MRIEIILQILIVIFANDQAFAADQVAAMSFGQVYSKILDQSLRIETQKNKLGIAQAQYLKPLGQFTPQLSIVGKEVQTGDPRYEQRPLNVTLSMNIFRFGADRLEFKSSDLNRSSSEERLTSEKLGTEDDALSAIFGVIRATHVLQIYQSISKNRNELLRIAEERFKKGLLARQEVDKIQIDFENAKARESDQFNELKDAEAKLAGLLGSTWGAIDWPWVEVIKAKVTSLEQEFKIESIPQFRAATLSEDASAKYASAQHRKLLPSLDLNFTYGTADLTNNSASGSANTYAGMLTLTIPLFEQLITLSNYRQAEAARAQASAEKAFLQRDLEPHFQAAKKRLSNSLESLVRREKNLLSSRHLYEDNLARFRQGRVSVNDLLIDQTRLSDAELLAVDATYNLHLNYERFCHAIALNVDVNANCTK